jgi:hypothetical protein
MPRQSSIDQVPGTGVTVLNTFGAKGAQIFVAPAGGKAAGAIAWAKAAPELADQTMQIAATNTFM